MVNRGICFTAVLVVLLGAACWCPAADDGGRAVRRWLLAGPFTDAEPGECLERPPPGPLATSLCPLGRWRTGIWPGRADSDFPFLRTIRKVSLWSGPVVPGW